MFVITVKNILISCYLGPKMGHHFARYKREFVITVIVTTEFDCIAKFSNHINLLNVVIVIIIDVMTSPN